VKEGLINRDDDVSCLGPLSGLKTQRERYARTVGALADPKLTAIMLVARPERVALMEAARTSAELLSQAMKNQLLVINSVFVATDRNDPLATAFERRGAEALLHIPEEVASLPRAEIPLIGSNIVGLDALRSLFTPLQRGDSSPSGPVALPQDISRLADLVDELGQSDHGLIMVMGKGGVGKTTVAAAVAVSLAKRGMPVHLTTTDPAQHIWEMLQAEVTGLRVSYIDPKQEVRQYRQRMLESARASLSAEKLALFEEELKSPCYEEVAVFQAFSRIVMGARKELVVMDMAPTGHTILLLDTAGAYHRQLT
jgi:arsenite-transporting ATPase